MADDVILAKYRLELDGFKKDIDEINQKFDKTQKDTTQRADRIGKSFEKVGGMIAGAFAVDQLVQFGKEIIRVTGEFQKFEAVLTNTLGSNSAAQLAMAEIVQFAATTPFQVAELTDAFVKLANQGFRPTQDEMRKLGDVAASTGKSFDQLTEAIIDAQVGEFERLKEFGIRAQKQGDQVTFTFKEVETQVDFTADSIREYVLSLGDLEGVSGATDAIAKTLTGQISMLKDSVDLLMVSIGNGTSGALVDFIQSLNEIVTDTRQIIELNDGWWKSALRVVLKINPALSDAADLLDETVEKQIELNNELERSELAAQASAEAMDELSDAIKNTALDMDLLAETFTDTDDSIGSLAEQIKLTKEFQKNFNEESERYAELQIKIWQLEQQRADNLDSIREKYDAMMRSQGELIDEQITTVETATIKTTENMAKVTRDAVQVTIDADENARIAAMNSQDRFNDVLEEYERQASITASSFNALGVILNSFNNNSKAMALFQIGIGQAEAIANFLVATSKGARKDAEQGNAAAIASTLGAIATFTAITISNISQARKIAQSEDVPRFYQGTEYLTGARGKDQIPVLANYGERIIPTLDNARIGRDLSNKELVDAALIYKALRKAGGSGVPIDYGQLAKIERKGVMTIVNKLDELKAKPKYKTATLQ